MPSWVSSGWDRALVDDTASVTLDTVVTLMEERDWSLLDSLNDVILASSNPVNVSESGSHSVFELRLSWTCLFLGFVSVLILMVNLPVFPVDTGISDVSTVATMIVGDTINELLLREIIVMGVSQFKSKSTLSDTGGGKSPARSALSLVLNRSDDIGVSSIDLVVSPIESLWSGEQVSILEFHWWIGDFVNFFWIVSSVLGLEFLQGHVGPSIDTNGVGLLWVAVVLLDELETLVEDSQSVVMLLWGGI